MCCSNTFVNNERFLVWHPMQCAFAQEACELESVSNGKQMTATQHNHIVQSEITGVSLLLGPVWIHKQRHTPYDSLAYFLRWSWVHQELVKPQNTHTAAAIPRL